MRLIMRVYPMLEPQMRNLAQHGQGREESKARAVLEAHFGGVGASGCEGKGEEGEEGKEGDGADCGEEPKPTEEEEEGSSAEEGRGGGGDEEGASEQRS